MGIPTVEVPFFAVQNNTVEVQKQSNNEQVIEQMAAKIAASSAAMPKPAAADQNPKALTIAVQLRSGVATMDSRSNETVAQFLTNVFEFLISDSEKSKVKAETFGLSYGNKQYLYKTAGNTALAALNLVDQKPHFHVFY